MALNTLHLGLSAETELVWDGAASGDSHVAVRHRQEPQSILGLQTEAHDAA